ncbi:S8/S53 family peptidase [Streptosporangium sp. 'caverna']|uniref:S8/S53 family peptidase n=1 Tax=Streptosporangium sp. 'caverna' TaxID=2202249 RepID=UPI000D7E4418|nr:S8/S53 family peptidase [Streptosporangium sp. 'caverna']AWS40940.1 peptidase S8 [Streptosporangium sp. 'caverna']
MAPDRFQEQFDQIQRAMADIPLSAGPDDAPEFLYEKGYVLARDEEAHLVVDAVADRFRETPGRERLVRRAGPETNLGGVSRIQVGDPGEGGGWSDRNVSDALRVMRDQEYRAGRRLVSRNHMVTIAVNCCPGDEPVPRALPRNPEVVQNALPSGNPVSVLVIDTGLVRDYKAYWEEGSSIEGDLNRGGGSIGGDGRVDPIDDRGILKQYVGHGTFIAGLVAAVAPDTRITVRNTLQNAGAISEYELGGKLFEAVSGGWPDIISLSAGTPNGCHSTLKGLEPFMEALRAQDRTLLVAAAGNNSSATPFWPAAYAALPGYEDAVVSVGALRGDGEFGACFSNHGSWVKVYAPGEGLVSTFTGIQEPVRYEYQHSTYDACRYGFSYACTCQRPRHVGALSEKRHPTPDDVETTRFDGLAQWSGTSFATPLVVGMIADYMTANKETDPRKAARELFAANTGLAEVRGCCVPALRPTTWSPTSVVKLPSRS